MAMPNVITAQTGGRQFDSPDILKYSLFVGGVNATHHALSNYSPLMDGFGRLFMVRPPTVLYYLISKFSALRYSSYVNPIKPFDFINLSIWIVISESSSNIKYFSTG